MENKTHPLTIPGAIIIAAAIIAIAIIYVKKPAPAPVANNQAPSAEISLPPINQKDDHVLGNPSAQIKLVEYSDPSCPYCKTFHPTMKKLLETYGPAGDVAWVYRAFPIDQIHPNARKESEAMECAASLGGNVAFWKYADRLYEVTQSDKGIPLDPAELPNIATFSGLDATAFNTCLSSGQFAEKVHAQYLGGVNAGVSGTPSTIVVLSKPAPKALDAIVSDLNIALRLQSPIMISPDRLRMSISGALPDTAFKAIIDAVLAGK